MMLETEDDGNLTPQGSLAVNMVRVLMRRFGIEGVLQLVEHARRAEYPPSPLPDDCPLDNLELMTRTVNALTRHGIKTVGDVRAILRDHGPLVLVQKVKHFGRRSDRDIKEAIGFKYP